MRNMFEVRYIDGIYFDDSWIWNSSICIGHFTTSAKDEKRAFTRFLKNYGVTFLKGQIIIESIDGGNILEVQDRKTRQPLFAAIYKEQ